MLRGMRLASRALVHPLLVTPLAVRLSQWSLKRLVALYIAASLVVTLVLGLGLYATARPHRDLWPTLRATFSVLWGDGELLTADGQTVPYYVLAASVAVAGTIMPLFFLGAFVFKLFRRETIVWRDGLSVIDYRDLGPTLVFRFYNGSRSPLVDVSIRVSSRVSSRQPPPLLVNNWMDVFIVDHLAAEACFPRLDPGMPSTVRTPLGGNTTADAIAAGPTIPVPGYEGGVQDKALVEFMVVARGTVLATGDSFVSFHHYSAGDVVSGHPQEISFEPAQRPEQWAGWDRYDDHQDIFLFAYGSMVNVESIASTLAYTPTPANGPIPAVLEGFERRWNVGVSATSREDRIYERRDGTRFTGMLVYLGIAPSDGGRCTGAVYRLSSHDLWRLDLRELNYLRIDVSETVKWSGRPAGCLVYTYQPKDEVKYRLIDKGEVVVIRQGYLRLVRDGFAAMSAEALDEFDRTLPQTAFPEQDLTFEMVKAPDPAMRILGEENEPEGRS
jgi:cation transport regulator ChaC